MEKIKGLDTLRAFAVFFVIIQHFGVWFDYTSPSGKFITNVLIPDGGFGVDLFFVLSGFLITSILLKAKIAARGNDRFVLIRNFFIRRALRIFPIYYLLLFLLFAINYHDIRHYFIYFVTYTANILSWRTNSWNSFSHTWTLAVEEQFYILWPWLIIFVREKYLKYVFGAAIITGICSTYYNMEVQGHMGPLLVFNCFDAFGMGGLYAWARLGNDRLKRFETATKVLAVIALCLYFYWKIAQLRNYPLAGLSMIKTVNAVIALWLIILVINNRSAWIGKYLLGNRFLNYIGKISYGIYLYHYVYLGLLFNTVNGFLYRITLPYPALNKTIHDSHVDYWIEVSVMIGIAAISYALIEKPLLNLKKYFTYIADTQEIRSGV